MCMTFSSSVPGAGTFIATDTRMMWYDGEFYDVGGKLVFTGNGFATGTGDHEALTVALKALRDPERGSLSAVDAVKHALSAAELKLEGRPDEGDFMSVLLIEVSLPFVTTVTTSGQ